MVRTISIALVLVVGCGSATDPDAGSAPDAEGAPDAGPRQALDYTEDRYWLCRPGLASDQCLDADLTATEVLPDGSMVEVVHEVATDPAYDCFYVYPTVALDGPVGPVDESALEDIRPMLDPLLNQAARFTGQCRVLAPLYRQVTLTTYLVSGTEDHLAEAYVDVEAAFAVYLRDYAGDRPFVVMGHSQGAAMVRMLLQRVIEPDPALLARLIVALPIGGDVEVPTGEVLGGTLATVPICSADDEVGCAIGYRSYAEGYPPTGRFPMTPGLEVACANPGALSGGEGRLRDAYFPTFAYQPDFAVETTLTGEVSTPFILLRDFYAAECMRDAAGRRWLELRERPAAGDTRTNPVPLDAALFDPGFVGLHVLDYNFALGDLLRVVEAKAAAHGR